MSVVMVERLATTMWAIVRFACMIPRTSPCEFHPTLITENEKNDVSRRIATLNVTFGLRRTRLSAEASANELTRQLVLMEDELRTAIRHQTSGAVGFQQLADELIAYCNAEHGRQAHASAR